jgi:hypothetical protein
MAFGTAYDGTRGSDLRLGVDVLFAMNDDSNSREYCHSLYVLMGTISRVYDLSGLPVGLCRLIVQRMGELI